MDRKSWFLSRFMMKNIESSSSTTTDHDKDDDDDDVKILDYIMNPTPERQPKLRERCMDHDKDDDVEIIDCIMNLNPNPNPKRRQQKIRERCMELQIGSFYIAKEQKKNSKTPFGEDAHFINEIKQVFGLADGVGGWAKKGIDSGKYASELMENTSLAVLDNPTDIVDPMQVLEAAYSKTKCEGSSTACIVTLNNDLLQAVNVGDSGFVVIRDGQIVCKTTPQQHRFNCPYQLGSSSASSPPSKGEEIFFQVKLGDVVVAGTDGLFDNVYQSEIVDLVNTCCRNADAAAEMASKIATVALSQSYSQDKVSPFAIARAARKAAGSSNDYSIHRGGKIDDITVIVAHVVLPLLSL